MESNTSLLIGSGFSIPAGMPSVWDINAKFVNLADNPIWIHTDMRAGFLPKGQEDINRRLHSDKHRFIEGLIKYYISEHLDKREDFNYEPFYDFFTNPSNDPKRAQELEAFCGGYTYDQYNPTSFGTDASNLLAGFERTFAQLIASELSDASLYRNNCGYIDGTHHCYQNYLSFVSQLAELGNVEIHSLNHDLLMEFVLGFSSATASKYCDGFEKFGTEFYGDVEFPILVKQDAGYNRNQHVLLSRYIGEYSRPIRLSKLHGSIDLFQVSYQLDGQFTPQQYVKREYGMADIWTDKSDRAIQTSRLERLYRNVEPLFLSGTTNKTRYYGHGFPKLMLDRFATNLRQAKSLIVCGYGFGDSGINKFVEDEYLSRDKRITVIDPFELKRLPSAWKPHVDHLKVGIDQLSSDQISAILKGILN